MNEDSTQIIKSARCARVIQTLSTMYGISLSEATDMYYNSETSNMIEEGLQIYIVAVRNIFLKKSGKKFTKQINIPNVHIQLPTPSRNG